MRVAPMLELAVVVPASNEPPYLDACLAAIHAADDGPQDVLVVREPPEAGPAALRNAGARATSCDVVVFVDADVEVHRDAFTRIRAAFDNHADLTAVFGSYDDTPSAPDAVSQFRNLLHHHVHTTSAGPATTFWAALGAIRRDAFLAIGGFDDRRYRTPSIEDVDLGMRLTARGGRILLDPELRATHAKRWTLWTMVRTDFSARGVPWVRLLLRTRSTSAALNLSWRHRLSAAVSVAGAISVARRRPRAAAAAMVALVALNRPFYALLLRRRGPLEAGLGVGLHALHHLTATAAIPVGITARLFAGEDIDESASLRQSS